MFGLLILVLTLKVCVGVEYCKEWVSPADWQFRSHCYWYHTVSTSISTFEADDECALTGDGLAPYIDNDQYQFILSIRPGSCNYAHIGVMDVGKEDTWTHLDGTDIANNGFTSTFDTSTSQPNGGTGQNCAIINKCSHGFPTKTQDKECHTLLLQEMICYRNTLGTKNCLTWVSKSDGKRRTHCYWVASKYPSMTSFTVTEAMGMCRHQGGTIALIIDDEQFQFVKNITDYYLSVEPSAVIWTGTHNRGTRGQNWNRDPYNVSTSLISSAFVSAIEESCLTITSSGVSWKTCTTSSVFSVVCYKTPTTLVVSTNISMQDILQEITINPTQTNAYRLSKISVYEDRPTAKAIGYVGIAIFAGTILFIIILDCQRLDNLGSKPKQKTRKTSARIQDSQATVTPDQ